MSDYKITVEDNRVYFIGEVNQFSVDELTQALHKLNIKYQDSNVKRIRFHITSDGGFTSSGLELYDLLNKVDLELYIYLKGQVGSAATLTAFTKHKTLMYNNSFLMFHELINTTNTNYSNAKSSIDYATKLMDKYITIYNTKTNVITKDWLVIDKYLSAQEAKEYNIIDEIF